MPNIQKRFILALVASLTLLLGSAFAAEPAPEQPAEVAAAEPEMEQNPLFEPHLKADEKVIHPPYEWGDCAVCHTDAKGEEGLISEPPELCYMCHTPKDDKKFIHGPVAAGACTACHNPHESENQKLLVASSINELCTSCHMAKEETLAQKGHIHPPVADSCINCHDPHTADYKFQLPADPKMDLCVMCHVDKKEWTDKVSSKHGAIHDRPQKCQECHDPHGTDTPKMLKKPSIREMCLSCHNEPLVTVEDGYKLQDIATHLEKNPDWHGPILWDDCAACHNPHGSDNLRMLKKAFPKSFYSKFDKNNYICFECHEPEKMTEQFTTTATNFRNGDKNMHFLHVNGEKGRTCRACHDFHGTKDYPHHLRKKTKFGKINFPIRYIETATGGSCAPACHARRHYDRETPKVNLK